ncbi:putative uncharacterized oxidoreductase [Tolypocladium ophioglossoides CBS 100239]|uniref:Uncharacterized oxidoreductase n=1 Tax=Tolypocladium ophioglossoides (strain CBS 100239) TaxID=1163406 RepID=A0A0L0N4T2_TOLOC|nr:putative uncharacterized oxidoreductase [Tolypocladium ophioglossoides CBS 100239]
MKLTGWQSGYDVTATVRSKDKAQQVLREHPAWEDKVHFGFVPDVSTLNAYDKLFDKPYDFIIHTASPVTFKVDDIQKDLIDPAVHGTLGLLQSAKKLGGSKLKRVVLLGSAVSVLNSFEEEGVKGREYTEEDWNPVTAEDAIERQDAILGYNVSKKLAEKAAWNFMDENETAFDLTIINPDIVIGPMLHPVPGPHFINETNKFAIYSFMDGTHRAIGPVLFPFYHFVDVRDVAKAHVLAMTAPGASNKRMLLVSGLITPQLVANTIRKNLPELRDRVAEGNPAQIYPTGVNPTGWDVSMSHEVFGKDWKYRRLEQSVVDTVRDILRREDHWSAAGSG